MAVETVFETMNKAMEHGEQGGSVAGVLCLLYGTVAYVIFLGALLYAVGFVGNIGVPKSIDSGEAGPLVPSLLINVLLIGIFALQHAGMARKGFKRWWTRFVPQPIERITYVLISSLALILLYWQWQPLPGVIWSIESQNGQAVAYALFGVGWATVLLATFMVHHLDLFGMRQVWLRFQGGALSWSELPDAWVLQAFAPPHPSRFHACMLGNTNHDDRAFGVRGCDDWRTERNPTGPLPAARTVVRGVYDSTNKRLTIFRADSNALGRSAK